MQLYSAYYRSRRRRPGANFRRRGLYGGLLALTLLASACAGPGRVDERSYAETEREALGHIGDLGRLRWARVDQGQVELSCIDGRAGDELLGTPGGDAGELLLLLAAAEGEGRTIDPDQVPGLIDAWIGEFGSFYMHTDTHALAKLGEALADDPRFAAELDSLTDATGELELERLEAWLRSPPPALHEPLLVHLIDPDTVGCGHLSAMLRASEDYAIQPALVAAVITGFYRRLWSAPEPLRFVVLHGQHHEHAILDLEVEVGAELAPEFAREFPLIRPSNTHDQMFVIHPQAIAAVRKRAAAMLVADHPELDVLALEQRMGTLGSEQLDATIAHLDVHVPTIRVVVNHATHRDQVRRD